MVVDQLEFQVISILRERMYFLKFTSIIREELFESPQTRHFYKMISDYHAKNRVETIPLRSLKILLYSEVKEQDRSRYRGMLRQIRRAEVSDSSIVEDLIKRFAKRQILKHAILDAVNSLETGEETDLERVRQKIEEAIAVDGMNKDDTYDYFKDPLRRIHDESTECRIATKISAELDRAMNGGLGIGEIGIILASTGVGKTLTLVNIGYGAMLQGKKVVHATLEIKSRKAARRYDVRISGRNFKDIREDPSLVEKKLVPLKRIGAGLHIKDYTASLCSVQDLRVYLERLRAKGFNFDLVIVDHADLMYSPRQYKERRFELSSIVAGLRRLASEFAVPVWTASQATRKAGEAGKTRLWDIAEDIGKANWADFIITISQSDQEKEESIAYLNLAKTREDGGNPKVQVVIDYETMKMKSTKREPSDVRSGHRT